MTKKLNEHTIKAVSELSADLSKAGVKFVTEAMKDKDVLPIEIIHFLSSAMFMELARVNIESHKTIYEVEMTEVELKLKLYTLAEQILKYYKQKGVLK